MPKQPQTQDHDFDTFVSKLPQWARAHVHRLQDDNDKLRRQVADMQATWQRTGEDATVFLVTGFDEPDRPLNGGPEEYPGARDHTRVRFGKQEPSWDGIRINWTNRGPRRGRWLELNAGDGTIEIRPESSNLVFVRQAER